MQLIRPDRTRRRRDSDCSCFPTFAFVAALSAACALWPPARMCVGDEPPAAAAAPQPAPNEIAGTIVDLAGFPVANAYVDFAEKSIWQGATTDRAGRFRITGEPGPSKLLIAWSQRSARMAVIPIAGEMPADRRYRLDCREVNGEGRVVDRNNRLVAASEVVFHFSGPRGMSYSRVQKTDADGTLSAEYVPAAPGWTLRAALAGGESTAPIRLDEGTDFDLPDLVQEQPAGAEAVPAPAMVLHSGRVLDEQGRPIAGVSVRISTVVGPGMVAVRRAVTGADGRWSRRLRGDLHSVEIRLDHSEFVGFEFDLRQPTPPLHALRDGTAVQTMPRGERIRGTVRDASGAPVGNALVLAAQSYARTPGPHWEPIEDNSTTRSAADGSFSIGGIPRGLRHVVALADGFSPARIAVTVQEQTPPLALALDRGRTITGRIVDEAGNPVANVPVAANEWTMPGSYAHHLSRVVVSESDGRFSIQALPRQGTIEGYVGGRREKRLGINFDIVAGVDDVGDVPLYPHPIIGGKVVDAETGEPITKFTVTSGNLQDDGRFSPGGETEQVANPAGEFESRIDWIILSTRRETTFVARILAPGYVQALTPGVVAGRPYRPAEIRLRKADPLTGRIETPDHKPASGAKVYFVGPENDAMVTGTILNDNLSYTPDIRMTAGADGAFELASPGENGRLLILHDAGYAIAPAFAFKPARTTVLTPWARIEGTYRPRGQPRSGANIYAEAIRPLASSSSRDHLSFLLDVTTDAEGRFNIERVPALQLQIGALLNAGYSASKVVRIEPGRTNVVTLADEGPPVTGRVHLAGVIAAHPPANGLAFDTSTSWVRAIRMEPAPELPAGADAADWASQLKSVLDGKPADELTLPATFAKLQTDGTFSIDALAPGRYVLLVEIRGERAPNTCGWGLILARGRSDFAVAREPLELPAIDLALAAHPVSGGLAPEIAATTAAGDAFRLSALRGKYVVLDFWAGWCAPCRASQPALQALHKRYAEQVTFVGLNFDYSEAQARKAITAIRSPWPQLLTGPWDTASPTLNAYGVESLPSLWLIDPAGKVLGRHLTHEELADLLGQVVGR